MSESKSELVRELAKEFLERSRKGQRPPLREYTDRHPELADKIREVFPAMAMMENIAVADETVEETCEESKGQERPLLRHFGDYRVIREIGRGGMGVVYEAEQVSLGRHVALKVLPHKAMTDPRTKKRFEREAKAAAKLHHTNIVPVFGVGEHDGLPYYAMQFIQGMGLDKVIEELARLQHRSRNGGAKGENPLDESPALEGTARSIARSLMTGTFRADSVDVAPNEPEPSFQTNLTIDGSPGTAHGTSGNASGVGERPEVSSASSFVLGSHDGSGANKEGKKGYWHRVAGVGFQIALALEYAHGQGTLHRDIKPSNLLLDTRGTVWVADFGLAKAAGENEDNLTDTGDILGTLRYMPPEAFEGTSDARGDLYSLGLTLYELIAGQPAFALRDRNKLIKLVTTGMPEPLGRVCLGVPRDLETIVQKAIDRDPARRYQTAGELGADLQRFIADEPIKARRQTQVERYLRWARRNPGIALLAGVLSAVLILATMASLLAAGYFNRLRWNEALAAQGERVARLAADQARDAAQRNEKAERWERYRANMIAAGSAMQLHNVGAARAALDATPKEYRNWEWNHFYQQLDTAAHIVRVGDDILGTELSVDGGIVAVQYAKGPARLWNLCTRQEIGALSNRSPAIWFDFSPDNKTLAYVVKDDDSIFLWDIATGRERAVLSVPVKEVSRPPFSAKNGRLVGKPSFSPDGRRLVANYADRSVRVWDTATHNQLLVWHGHEEGVKTVAFSPDGRRIVSAGVNDRTALLWDAESGRLQAALSGHDAPVGRANFNLEGDRVVSVEDYPSNALRLWNAGTGKLLAVLRGHTNLVNDVAFSPDGTRIASGGLDQTVRLWDGRTGQALASREGHRGWITTVAFSPDSKYLISAAKDQTARLWDATAGTPLGVLHGHTGAIAAATYTKDGSTIVTVSDADGTVRLWDARSVERNGALRGHENFVYGVAFHPDGERVASASWDGTVRIWDATTGREISLLSYPPNGSPEKTIVTSVAFHPAGNLVATTGRDDAVRLWDLATAKEVHRFKLPIPQGKADFPDSRTAFSSRGHMLAAGDKDSAVHIWDVDRRSEIAVLKGHRSLVNDVCFSPDDSWLATAAQDRTIRIWNLSRMDQFQVLEGHTDMVYALAVSHDGRRLASGSVDGTARVWDTNTWKEIASLKHGTNVYGVAFSPDGTRLACACANNMIRFWDMATFQLVAELERHGAYVHQIAFSPDGTRLVSGSGDFTVRLWDSLSVPVRAKPVPSK